MRFIFRKVGAADRLDGVVVRGTRSSRRIQALYRGYKLRRCYLFVFGCVRRIQRAYRNWAGATSSCRGECEDDFPKDVVSSVVDCDG